MKNKLFYLLLLSTVLVSCGPSNTPSESEVESILQDEPFELFADDFPPSIAGGYPSDGTYKINDKDFYLSNVMQNNGKYNPTLTIQMKKEGSYFYNQNAINGLKLEITLMKNDTAYTGPMHFAPTLYVSDEINFGEETIESTLLSEDETMITYSYEGSQNFTHMKIVNESSFAQYLYKVSWVK